MIIDAQYHGFGLLDDGELPEETADYSNGPAGFPDVSAWDEVIEAPVSSPTGQLRLETYEGGPVSSFSVLSASGPGEYRLRAYARGRDHNFDLVSNECTEEYVLIVWPAAGSSTNIIKATDACGRDMRLASQRRPHQ